MKEHPEFYDQHVNKKVGVCTLVGMGFGLVLGILFGIAFDQLVCIAVGAGCGAIMGLAI